MKRKLFYRLMSLMLGSLTLFACDGISNRPTSVKAIGEKMDIAVAVDCTQICRSKKLCVNKDYNLDSCISACTGKAAVSEKYARQIDACENCLETGHACNEALTCYSQSYCAPIFES